MLQQVMWQAAQLVLSDRFTPVWTSSTSQPYITTELLSASPPGPPSLLSSRSLKDSQHTKHVPEHGLLQVNTNIPALEGDSSLTRLQAIHHTVPQP